MNYICNFRGNGLCFDERCQAGCLLAFATGKKQNDLVNHPPHYTQSHIECIDAIEAELGKEGFIAYLRGNITKYIWRGPHKNQLQDYKKAEFYLNRLIYTMKKEEEKK